MGRWRKPMIPLVLSAILSLLASPGGYAADRDCRTFLHGIAERSATSQVLLSLRLARERNDGKKVSYYKSIVRQRRSKGRDASGEGIRQRGHGRVISGGAPPSGR